MGKIRTALVEVNVTISMSAYQMADSDRVVITHTTADIPMIINDWSMPACATTQARRKNNITPQMFKRHGIRTPTIHPNFMPWCPAAGSASRSLDDSYNEKHVQALDYYKPLSTYYIDFYRIAGNICNQIAFRIAHCALVLFSNNNWAYWNWPIFNKSASNSFNQ